MDIKLQGQIISKSDKEKISDDLEKQTLLVKETTGEYPNQALITFFNKDKQLKDKKEGDIVEVYLNFKTSEYKGKTYNNITGWRVEKIQDGNGSISEQEEEDTDLPF